MKTFTYQKVTNRVYSPILDDYVEETDDICYNVDDKQLLSAVVDLVFEDYFMNTELVDRCNYGSAVRNGLKKFIEDNDNLDQLVEDYEDRLKDYFEEDAIDE